MMSLSPSTSAEYDHPTAKRRRTSFPVGGSARADAMAMSPDNAPPGLSAPSASSATHIPKRGARACTACRKGKNRCEGEVRPALSLPRPAPHDARGPRSRPARPLPRLLVVGVS